LEVKISNIVETVFIIKNVYFNFKININLYNDINKTKTVILILFVFILYFIKT